MNPILARVREVLRETGETQRALEQRGVAPQQLLSRWSTIDEAEPSASSLAKFAIGLGINGHWLLTGQGEKRLVPSAGADVVFQAGVTAGVLRAEAAIRALREATSAGADAEASRLEVIDTVSPADRAEERPQPGTRKRGSGPKAAGG